MPPWHPHAHDRRGRQYGTNRPVHDEPSSRGNRNETPCTDGVVHGAFLDLERITTGELREGAGRPPYRELARQAHFSAAAFCDAAAGRLLPTLPVTTAYARACGPARQAPPPSVARLFAGFIGNLLVRVGAAMVETARVRQPEMAERNSPGT
jgi:hypothetical protein